MDKLRFTRLWNSLFGIDAKTPAENAWREIAHYYALKDRFYHTGEHITFCLQQFDEACTHLEAAREVEMALWFHDIIYQMDSEKNEADSADFFCQLVGDKQNCLKARDRIASLIMDTTHKSAPASIDGRYLADVDISSLARPWEEFLQDSLNVRKESPHLSDVDYKAGQRKFFQSLLNRPHVFYTQYFRQHSEQQARDNLEKMLTLSI
ncbi:HD domain-containing protein [Aestuariirhabdus sp. LZHN29]|uniref:HD domain-containing protein n=1 Tax=Aestuariirhabdus sp. LZHN29 TaxID=3417462 RepID=UPI003CF69DC3